MPPSLRWPPPKKWRDILKSIGHGGRKAILSRARRLQLHSGALLFSLQDEPRSLFFVLSGTLGVYAGPPQREHLISIIRSGESVGEMALLAGRPRSATVVALRDCDLLELSWEDFTSLSHDFPELTLEMSRQLIDRLHGKGEGTTATFDSKVTALLSGTEGLNMADIAHQLCRLLMAQGARVLVMSPSLSHPNFSKELSKLERLYDHILLYGEPGALALNSLCARQSDRVLLFVQGRYPPIPLVEDFSLKIRAEHHLVDLVIVNKKGSYSHLSDRGSLKSLPFNRHFYVDQERSSDWARLARIISGRSIGVVLSGGGARAYAHLGVLKALQEQKIPIDFIGGVSMGAILAACVAMGWSFETIVEKIRDSFVRKSPLTDYSLPLVGLIRGKRVETLLQTHFAQTKIEDTPIPFFCLSTNLTSGESEIHDEGLLWKALRASVSLPGILPPVLSSQGILVDGAVLSNLPVDVMQKKHQGPTLASDVTRDLALTTQWLEEEYNKSLFSKMLRPPLISLLIRAGTVSGEATYHLQQEQASLVITPPLEDVDLRDWKALDRAMALGYHHARDVLKTWDIEQC